MRAVATLCRIGILFASGLYAADPGGIWMGEVAGRNGEKQDLAFQFQAAKGAITGVMFGDEFDLPVQDLKIEGDRITFSVANINFYDNRRIKTVYSGILTDKTMELRREQLNSGPASKPTQPKDPPPLIVLKRIV